MGPALLLLAALIPAARAAVQLRVVETDPASPATLGHWEKFAVRLACGSDRLVRLRVRAYHGAREVTSITGGMPPCGPGPGEAVYWLSFARPERVDRLVAAAHPGLSGEPLETVELPVELSWTGKAPEPRTPAPWVERLLAEQELRLKAEAKAYRERPGAWKDSLLGAAVIACLPLYCLVQPALLLFLPGRWRLAAALPLLPMAAALAHAVFAFRAGSNIFPLVLIFASVPALLYLAAILAAYLWRRRSAAR